MKRTKTGIKMIAAVMTVGMLCGAPATSALAHHNSGHYSNPQRTSCTNNKENCNNQQKTYCTYHKKYHSSKNSCKKYCTTHNKTHKTGKKHC